MQGLYLRRYREMQLYRTPQAPNGPKKYSLLISGDFSLLLTPSDFSLLLTPSDFSLLGDQEAGPPEVRGAPQYACGHATARLRGRFRAHLRTRRRTTRRHATRASRRPRRPCRPWPRCRARGRRESMRPRCLPCASRRPGHPPRLRRRHRPPRPSGNCSAA